MQKILILEPKRDSLPVSGLTENFGSQTESPLELEEEVATLRDANSELESNLLQRDEHIAFLEH